MATATKARRARQPDAPDPFETAILAASGGDKTLARSYVIARERGLVGTAWLVGEHGDQHEGVETWEVPSMSHAAAGVTYGVKVHHRHGFVHCPCAAGAYGAPCGHKGAVAYALYQRATEREAVSREFAEWGFWDGVQGVTYA